MNNQTNLPATEQNIPDSLWSATSKLPEFERLEGDLHTDVLIIGGGMSGILCAYMLQQAGVNYVLVEANTLCSKITKGTTAKITSQHGLIYHKLIKRFGTETAALYLQSNQEALNKFATLSKDMDCDFDKRDNFVYSTDDPHVLSLELDALQELNFPAKLAEDLPLPLTTAGAVMFPNQAQFHPLKFVNAISHGLHIYEHTPVRELLGCKARTDHGTITAKDIIVATHYPFLNKHGSYFLKMYQQRSYVLALDHAPDLDGMYVDQAKTGFSFRNHKGLLLLGGGSHRTGKSGGNWDVLRRFSHQYYPASHEQYYWAAQDCMTLDDIPYIGNYSKQTPHLYAITGFNKWGMTSSMVGAMLLTDLIMGKRNPYANLYSPSRSILRPQLAINMAESTVNLLTPTRPRCPHLGCALKWNPSEQSWDCPCHGSRFGQNGKLLDNPATGNLDPPPYSNNN